MARIGRFCISVCLGIALCSAGHVQGSLADSPTPRHPLEQAAQEGDLEQVKSLLAQDQSQYLRDSALRVAIRARHRDVTELLISHGARYALMIAAEVGDLSLAKQLLAKGADANERDSALHAAARTGHKEVAELLLTHGADVNSVRFGNLTPLFRAVTMGCDTDTLSRFANGPFNPFPRASAERKDAPPAPPELFRSIVRLLIEHGADVNMREKQNGLTSLHYAILGGDREIIEILLAYGAAVNPESQSEKFSWHYVTPLHLAAQHDRLAVCELLIERGADVNSKMPPKYGIGLDNPMQTPLYHAVQSGDPKLVRLLIDHGARVDVADGYGETPLHRAAERANRVIVEMLLSHGALVDATDDEGRTPLHYAAKRKDRSIVELLLSHGANADRKSRDGQTPVSIATQNGSEEIVRLLTGGHGRVTIHSAASTGDVGALERLVKEGIDVNRLDVQGQTALHAAANAGQWAAARWLVAHGANVNLADGKGTTALSVAIGQAYEAHVNLSRMRNAAAIESRYKVVMSLLIGHGATLGFSYGIPQAVVQSHCDEMADLIIEAGPNFEPGCDKKATLLHRAAWWGHKKAAEDLIRLGADLKAIDRAGGTPLHAAVQSGCTRYWDVIQGPHADILELLIAHGADVNAVNKGKATPLHGAADYGDIRAIALLLAKGAKIDATDSRNTTPLHRAATEGSIEAMKLLLAKGADPNVRDSEGNTPLLLLLASHSLMRDEARPPAKDFVLTLIEQGAQVNVENHEGVTLLQQAAALGYPDLLNELLTRGALVNRESATGWTALHSATASENAECVAMLLGRGARTDVVGRLPDMVRLPRFYWPGRTPLHIAASQGNDSIASLLIAAGANVNATDGAGKTPLYLALEQDHPSTARLLMDCGASRDATTEKRP